MKIKVLFFAKLRELLGTNQVDVTFTESDNKVSDVLAALRQKGEVWAEELNENKSFRIAVKREGPLFICRIVMFSGRILVCVTI